MSVSAPRPVDSRHSTSTASTSSVLSGSPSPINFGALKLSGSSHANVSASEGELPLQNHWTFWYDEKVQKGLEHDSYTSALKRLGEFGSVQEFWRYMNHIDVNGLPNGSNLRLFKSGIEPTWEDPANQAGGKYVFEVPAGVALRDAWTYTLLALVGETFDNNDSICGAVLSIRPRHLSTINIWNSCSYNAEDITKGEAAIQKLVVAKLAENKRQPVTIQLRYHPHQKSLDWNNLWTQTKSKETVLAQLAATEGGTQKKTLTHSPQSARRVRASNDSLSSPAKQTLRSSTGSMNTVTNGQQSSSTSEKSSTFTSGDSVSPRTGSTPQAHAQQADLRRSSGSGSDRSRSRSKQPLPESPRKSGGSGSSPPGSANGIMSSGYAADDTGHSSEGGNEFDGDDSMRSPFLMLGQDRESSSASSNDSPLTQFSSTRPSTSHSLTNNGSPKSAQSSTAASAVSPRSTVPSAHPSSTPHGSAAAHPSSREPASLSWTMSQTATPPPKHTTGSATSVLRRMPSVDGNDWASMSSLTAGDASGESDSAASSPRHSGVFGGLNSSLGIPSSLASASRTPEPAVQFSAVLQEIKSQWWLNRRNRRRGRPTPSNGANAAASPSNSVLSSSTHSASTSSNASPAVNGDSQLKVPSSISSSGDSHPPLSPSSMSSTQGSWAAASALPSEGVSASNNNGGLGNYSGLVLAAASAPTEKRKRKRPSRGGSRDKTRSKDASAIANAVASAMGPVSLSPPVVLEDEVSGSTDPEIIVHEMPPKSVVETILEAEMELKSRSKRSALQSQQPDSSLQHSSSTEADLSPSSSTLTAGGTGPSSSASSAATSPNASMSDLPHLQSSPGSISPSSQLLPPPSPSTPTPPIITDPASFSNPTTVERHTSFSEQVEVVSTPSVVIVGEEESSDGSSSSAPVKHHRRRSRGRGAGSSSSSVTSSNGTANGANGSSSSSGSSKKSRPSDLDTVPAMPTQVIVQHPHTPVLQYVQTFAMVFIIVLLMILCYLFGRMQGTSNYVLPHQPIAGSPYHYAYPAEHHAAAAAAAAVADPNLAMLRQRPPM